MIVTGCRFTDLDSGRVIILRCDSCGDKNICEKTSKVFMLVEKKVLIGCLVTEDGIYAEVKCNRCIIQEKCDIRKS